MLTDSRILHIFLLGRLVVGILHALYLVGSLNQRIDSLAAFHSAAAVILFASTHKRPLIRAITAPRLLLRPTAHDFDPALNLPSSATSGGRDKCLSTLGISPQGLVALTRDNECLHVTWQTSTMVIRIHAYISSTPRSMLHNMFKLITLHLEGRRETLEPIHRWDPPQQMTPI